MRRIRNLLHAHRATGTVFASSPSMSANSSYFVIVRRVGKFVSSLLIAVFVAAVLMGAVYGILPKNSFINLHSTPNIVQFERCNGQYEVHTSTLDVSRKSKISNDSDISVRISGDNSLNEEHYESSYQLKKGELEIIFFLFSSELNNKSNQQDVDSRFSYLLSTLVFNKEVTCYKFIHDENIEVEITFFGYMDTSGPVRICLNNGPTQLTLNPWNGWTRICIGDNALPPMDHVAIEFSSLTDELPILILNSESVDYNQAHSPTTISFVGTCKSFLGKSESETDTLKQTYLNVQKEYDVGLLQIAGIAADFFDVESKFSNEKNEIHVSGEAKEISMGGTSLNFNFMTFLYENLSSVLFAIFGAMLSTYLPMLLPEEKRKKE